MEKNTQHQILILSFLLTLTVPLLRLLLYTQSWSSRRNQKRAPTAAPQQLALLAGSVVPPRARGGPSALPSMAILAQGHHASPHPSALFSVSSFPSSTRSNFSIYLSIYMLLLIPCCKKKIFFYPISSSSYYITSSVFSVATHERGVCVFSASQTNVGSGPHRSTKNVFIKVIGGLLVAKSSGQLSPSLCLLACLQCLAQLLTPSSLTSFALTWLPGPLALLAAFSHHWLLCLSALWILAHFPDLSPSEGPRAQALLSSPLLLACTASLILSYPDFQTPFHVIAPSWASPLISVLYVRCLFHLFLHIQSASPIMCPQHTPELSFHVFTVSAECNPIHSSTAQARDHRVVLDPFLPLVPHVQSFRNS